MLFSLSDLKVVLRPKKSDDVILRRLIFKQSAILLKIACRSTAVISPKLYTLKKIIVAESTSMKELISLGARFYMLSERYSAKNVFAIVALQ